MTSFERGAYEPQADDVRVFDGAADDELEEEGSRLPLLIVIGLLVFAAFSGVVWLAYTQGVARGRQDAPRMIVADTGPVKTAPNNPGGTATPYTGLKIYQNQAPADEDEDTPPPTLAPKKPVPAQAVAATPSIRPADTTLPAKTTTAAAKPSLASQFVVLKPPPALKKTVPAATTNVAATNTANAAPVTAPPAEATPQPAVPPLATSPPANLSVASTQVAPKATAPAAGGGFVLQIGAYKSEGEATAAWHAYQAKHPLVGGFESDIKKVDLGDKGVWYRLRIGSFAGKDAAGALCDKLKADGGGCFPAKQ